GCLPGDFNEDGRIDLLVYFWGRTPILYLATGAQGPLSMASFRPVELVATPPGSQYRGEIWNTNAVTQADLDGDGHNDLIVGNYFPDGSHVLDANGPEDVSMQHSMSRAY